ncbi:hypothetical protein AB0950_09530 [Streptomyces sp. NPDC007189]|uniref:hypothetical protein n=1 Tax=Streptomyces sp. NPDC007189 TaxID=3154315 RepID=UPI003455857C
MKTKVFKAAVPAVLVPVLASTFMAVGTGTASASAGKCSVHQVTEAESNQVCLNVEGKGLTVKSIYGRYIGIWGMPKLTLYINGKLASSKKATKSTDDFAVYFPSKFDKKYSNGTTMRVCLSEVVGDFPAKSTCTPTIEIHS